MPPLITCQSVGYRQQGQDILAGIDWQIEPGRHWAVLGPNGAGKTTLLRIACGYVWPTSGCVLRLGRELVNLIELRRSIGWISSELVGRIPPRDTGLETVVSGRLGQVGLKRLPVGGPSEQDFADAADELARLDSLSLAAKPFGVLSQGERQQVLIARARMAGPMLLVLDEPCAGMDPGVRERFLSWLNDQVTGECRMTNVEDPPRRDEVRKTEQNVRHSSFVIRHSQSPTVVMVTHHMEEIVPGIENTLILRGGQVHCAGQTQEVVTRQTIEDVYRTRLSRIERSGGRLWPIWDG